MDIMQQEHASELVMSSFVLHENGLEPIDNPTFEQWLACGQFLKKANKSLYFWLGDWLNYGHRKWGEKYLEAVDRTGYDIGTLRNYKWIASRIPNDLRIEGLTMRHYEAVADSDIEYEEQKRLLHDAKEKKISSNDFKKYVTQQVSPSSPLPQAQLRPTPQPFKVDHLSHGVTNTEDPRQKLLGAKELLLNRIEQFRGEPEDIAWLYEEINDLVSTLTRIVDENGKSANP